MVDVQESLSSGFVKIQTWIGDTLGSVGINASENVIKILVYMLSLGLVYLAANITQKAVKIGLIILAVLLGILLLT